MESIYSKICAGMYTNEDIRNNIVSAIYTNVARETVRKRAQCINQIFMGS